MLALCLDGEMLVSAHQGQLLRLTHVATGRRLACRKLKHVPVCCHAANGYAAVADVTGAVHTFHADDGFATQLGAPLETAQFGGGALSVAVLAGREAVGGSAILAVRRGQGMVTVHELPSPEAASPLRFPELRFALTLEGEDGAEEGGEAAHVHPSLATSACDPSALYTVSRGGAARIDVEAERVVWSAPASPDLDCMSAGAVPATATAMANLEELTNLEEQLSSFGLGEQPLRDASRRAPILPHSEVGHPVHASYSAGWRLLAGVSAASCVVLWDERVEGRRGPVARLRLPFAGAPRCVQLDEASEGISTAAGHLLVSPPSGGSILVYDVRRLVVLTHITHMAPKAEKKPKEPDPPPSAWMPLNPQRKEFVACLGAVVRHNRNGINGGELVDSGVQSLPPAVYPWASFTRDGDTVTLRSIEKRGTELDEFEDLDEDGGRAPPSFAAITWPISKRTLTLIDENAVVAGSSKDAGVTGASTAAAASIVERELGAERGREVAPPDDTNRVGLNKRVRAEAQRRGTVGERRPTDAAVQAAARREAAEGTASAAELRELYGMTGASNDAVAEWVAGASNDAVAAWVA
eukprot:jgi/Chrpa1/2581/Chrysochromulina_OHIO_Genome00017946-RA